MRVVSIHHYQIAVQPARDGVLLVCLGGQFDMGVGTALADALRTAAQEAGVEQVFVDMQRVAFFDSHGIAGLVAGYEAARSAGRRFSVTNARGMVKHILDVTGLAEVLCQDATG
ncbi:STAS domain-containing protein [Winogradskya humida]|nr:STAS domain-containing protein [Actinoplanes humidus]